MCVVLADAAAQSKRLRSVRLYAGDAVGIVKFPVDPPADLMRQLQRLRVPAAQRARYCAESGVWLREFGGLEQSAISFRCCW